MNKTFIVLLAGSLLLLGAPIGAADEPVRNETNPDCEEGQWWIGYNAAMNDALSSAPVPVFVCEGEHWDGEDPLSDAESGEDIQNCATTEGVGADAQNEHLSFCQDQNPNAGGAEPLAGKPVTARVTTSNADSTQAAYIAVHIGGVGQAIVYTSDTMTAVYLRDSTVTGLGEINALAIVVSSLGITRGWVSEEDCSYDHYENAARNNIRDPSDERSCGRDNTAITIEYLP
jgi:hypothetical protein